jgi:hypothetical protein
MQLNKDNLVPAKAGYQEGTSAGDNSCVDNDTAQIVPAYKKTVCKSYISINADQIDTRLSGTEYYVTRKYDGELNILFFDGEDTFLINIGGKVRAGLPCLEDARQALQEAGVSKAVIACELCVSEEDGRTRIFDVLAALADKDQVRRLTLSPFDILELEQNNSSGAAAVSFTNDSYATVHSKLSDLFGSTPTCLPVRLQKVSSKSMVKDLFEKWVNSENSEGLIVRSELPLIYKVKPRYTLDAAVVGFSEGTGENKGQIRTLLLALMPEEGKYQIFGKTGNGFGEELKQSLLPVLSTKIIESSYIETDSNHVAFHMIKPDTVIELLINDVIFDTTSGPVLNPVLELVDGRFTLSHTTTGFSVVFPIFSRIREDKSCTLPDVRLAQISQWLDMPASAGTNVSVSLPASEIILRDVYKKEQKGKTMVQKFLIWKTNKEDAGYPAYVMHYTNYSPDRAEPMKRDIRISNSKEQIEQICDSFVESNIKKGWERVG